MGEAFLLAICIVFIIEGLMPLLIPDKWKQFLMQMALQPSESLRRIGGVMVVIGAVSAYFLINRI
ncbi:DUF2065 domain-containing protein [Alteromonas sp. W364]|jgi:uncharacterized protein YjeT (DUF2065 family)|uniref:DUF2065 domain-containing protein n=1 Tax=Alteromonas sp. W364 TaxID=3075610 RepID=UPI002885F970|nr:DUF2065 domain-containing protein [Alteromonas sp. W364]MDT0628765.1 DUF2065 domain-containing protein [Alteromonas sp. W364]